MVDDGTVEDALALEIQQTPSLTLPRNTGRGDQTPPWASGERSSRANNFDAIRLALAMLVIVSHAWLISHGRHGLDRETAQPLVWWTHGQIALGGVAVHGFFVVSGYLIAASWQHSRSPGDYLRKRVRRIYPGYLLATAVSLLIAGWAGAGWRFTAGDVLHRLRETVLLRDVFVGSAFVANPLPGVVNGSLWTIQYEFGCYLIVMAVGGLIVSGRARWVMAMVAVLSVLAAAVVWRSWEGEWGAIAVYLGRPAAWPRMASHFLAGVAFYICRRQIPFRWTLAVLATLLLVVGARIVPLLAIVSPLAFTYLLMWLAYHPRLRLQHAGRYGDFSYGVYLYAFPIQQSLVHAGITQGPWQNIAIATPLALIAGVLSWHGCEKWFVHYRVTGRRPNGG